MKKTDKVFCVVTAIMLFLVATAYTPILTSLFNFHQDTQGNENVGVTGHLEIWLINEQGERTKMVDKHNTLTNAWKNLLRDHIFDANQSTWRYIRIGNSSGGGAASTNLDNAVNTTIASYSEPTDYQARLTATFTFTTWSGQNITESGVVNWMHETDDGTLANYQDFTLITCGTNDQLEVQWTFTIS